MNHFSISEFRCRCCGLGDDRMRPELLERLDAARELAGVPFVITSGFRCEAHNRAVGGRPDSAHLSGWAADIACPDGAAGLAVLRGLTGAGFERIGIGRRFVHADCHPGRPRPAVWTYDGKGRAI